MSLSKLKLNFIQKKLRRWYFLDSYLKFLTTLKSIFIRNVDQISIANLITQFFTLNFATISVFVYKVLSVEKKLLKVVNNALTTGLWWSLTCQNSHADISQLIPMTDLINNHALFRSFEIDVLGNNPHCWYIFYHYIYSCST